MKVGLQAKFDQNLKLKQFLLDTGTTILVDANPKDKYWGAVRPKQTQEYGETRRVL